MYILWLAFWLNYLTLYILHAVICLRCLAENYCSQLTNSSALHFHICSCTSATNANKIIHSSPDYSSFHCCRSGRWRHMILAVGLLLAAASRSCCAARHRGTATQFSLDGPRVTSYILYRTR